MVKRGYTLIFIENKNRWGTPEQIEDQYEFIQYASRELKISNKVITIGMSCGGMMSVLLAANHPDAIDALYIDAPVMNFLSCSTVITALREQSIITPKLLKFSIFMQSPRQH